MSMTEAEVLEMAEAVEEELKTNVTFTIQTDLLRDVITKVERSVAKTAVKEVEKGIYLFVKHNQLVLRGTNSDFGTEVKVQQMEVPITKKKKGFNFEIIDGTPGGCVIIQKNFKAMINKLPRKTATISIIGTKAKIESGSTSYNLDILDHQEFYQFPTIDENAKKIQIHPEQLLEMYRRTSYAAAAKDSGRPCLTGVQHKVSDKVFSTVATDRHQMGKAVTELDDESNADGVSATIPAKSIEEIKKHLKDTRTVTIYFLESQVIFEFDNWMTYARILSDEYPNTDRMVPKEFTTEAQYRVKDIYDMVDRSLLLYESDASGASLKIKPSLKQTRILSSEDGRGDFKEDAAAIEAVGEDLHIGVNLRYILEALKTYDPTEIVKFQFLGNMRPFMIRKVNGNDNNFNLVLPVRLTSYDEEVTIDDFKAPVQIQADYDLDDIANDVEQEAEEVEEKQPIPVHPNQEAFADMDME